MSRQKRLIRLIRDRALTRLNAIAQWVPEAVPPPDPIRTTAGRAYVEAIGFFFLVLGVFAVTAPLQGAAVWGFHPGWSAWAERWVAAGLWGTLAVMTLWLAAASRCRLAWLWAIGITGLLAADAIVTHGAMNTPHGLYSAVEAATAVVLAVALARRHGVSPARFGFRRWSRHDPAGILSDLRVFWWAVVGCFASSIISTAIIMAGLARVYSPIHPGESFVGAALRVLAAGPAEEIVVAAVVIALEAGRRSSWEIYLVLAVMRVSYHLYYQTAGLGVVAMGVLYVWLYRRTRRLTPIIAAHVVTEVLAWNAAGAITAMASMTALITAQIYWLDPAANRQRFLASSPSSLMAGRK